MVASTVFRSVRTRRRQGVLDGVWRRRGLTSASGNRGLGLACQYRADRLSIAARPVPGNNRKRAK
jgi:hypothetical protein